MALIDGIETISTKNVDPIHPRAISVTHIEAGSTWNVIPRDAFIEGTVRTAYAEDRTLIHDRIRDIANGTSLAYGVEIDFDWEYGSPSVYNDPEWTQFAQDTAASLGLVFVSPTPHSEARTFPIISRSSRRIPEHRSRQWRPSDAWSYVLSEA